MALRLAAAALACGAARGEALLRSFRADAAAGLQPAQPSSSGAALAQLDAGETARLRKAAGGLLRFLDAVLAAGGKLPEYEDFRPTCMTHVRRVIRGVDHSYTDLQLQTVLEDQCSLDERFQSAESGFDDAQACVKFARRLAEARTQELEKQSLRGYRDFCKEYYLHRGGTIPEPESDVPEDVLPDELKQPKEPAKEPAKEPSKEPPEEPPEEQEAEEAKAPVPTSKAFHADDDDEDDSPLGRPMGRRGEFRIWPMALVVGGVLLFVAAGLVLRSRKEAAGRL
mmetsp:Transcript_68316/g.206529  ORF Transcript_68316/g.206529 Transcript_68316/m.206529 type:complete len:283 (+) Transcript_68316:1-849(+)